MPGAIDIVINLHTPEAVAMRPPREFLEDKIGVDHEALTGLTEEGYLERMDRAGIDMAFITASKSGPIGAPASYHVPYEMVAAVVERHPDRFRGLAGIDPNKYYKEDDVEDCERSLYLLSPFFSFGRLITPAVICDVPADSAIYDP